MRKSQVRVVEGIEILPPEFQGLSFRDAESFGQRKVEQVLRRPTQRALGSRTVAEGLLWGGVSGWVKPQVAIGIRDMGIPNDVGPNAVEICIQQRRVGDEGGERSAGQQSSDATETPTPDKRVRYLAGLSSPTAPLAERKIPSMEQRQGVGMVPAGRAVVTADVVVVREVVPTLGVGHGFRPGVSQQEIQPVGGPLLKFCLQRVVA